MTARMRIAVLGAGAREHALVRRLRAEGHYVIAMPGNDGIEPPRTRVYLRDHEATSSACAGCTLVIIGPEAPLADGLADSLRAAGLVVFGPGKAGARLESSKAYAKAFMIRHGVATADYVVTESVSDARKMLALDLFEAGVVLKQDGLAGGKGVRVCHTRAQAEAALTEMQAQWGDSQTLVLEARLSGRELSMHVLTDGARIVELPCAQYHKPLFDNNRGPNTGGMGAYSPVPFGNEHVMHEIRRAIVAPTIRGLQSESIDFRGVLYLGILLTADGPKLLEYNVRFGDPETQAILPRIASDLGSVLLRTARGALLDTEIQVSPGYSVAVVAASQGYPEGPRLCDAIEGLEASYEHPNTQLLFSGVRLVGSKAQTSGGRVLTVVAEGPSLESARVDAYARLRSIQFAGMHARSDIALSGAAKRVVILFSGRGSNLQALCVAMQSGILQGFAEPVLAVTNNSGAIGLEHARALGVPTCVLEAEDHEERLLEILTEARADYVLLAGYMRIVPPEVVQAFPRRMLNIHPADTAKHQGLNGYGWAFEQRLRGTFVTVHFVSTRLDQGEVIRKTPVDLSQARSVAEVEACGLAVEHQAYAKALLGVLLSESCAESSVSVQSRR
jgi:phosphoribosylamine---glycine ligase